jgi:ActR/RegA family two-component response regulator
MIMQTCFQFRQECPVCGRPLQIQSKYVGRLIACQHCRGQFVAGGSGGKDRGMAVVALSQGPIAKPPDIAEPRRPSQYDRQRSPSVLLVEYRDAFYDRIAAELACAGFRPIRAFCASEGIIRHFMLRPDLVVANVELPDQSGWLLTAKLAMNEPRPHVWLYASHVCRADAAKARLLGAEELLVYGTLQDLSDAVSASLVGSPPSLPSACEKRRLTVNATASL